MTAPKLLAFAATLRPESSNERLLRRAAMHLQSEGADVSWRHFSDFPMPLFSEIIPTRETLPEGGKVFLEALERADGLVIASPEYNWSFPAALKNLIDWISCLRPNPFAGKSALLLSASPSRRGGTHGLAQLRVPLESLHVHLYPRQMAVGDTATAFVEGGALQPILELELAEITKGYVAFARAVSHSLHPDRIA